jgi:multiple sugar transport system substrate-binding protein
MKSTRRHFAAGAALTATALATGFATTVQAQDKAEIRMATYTVSEAWDAMIQQMVDEFNAQSTLATVQLEFRPSAEYWDKLQTEYAGGNAPDITVNQSNWVIPGAARGMFLDLNPYYERDQVDLSDLWYDMTREWQYEGGIYGGLLYATGQALYYNKGLLEAASEPVPSADWTWDDLLESAQRLTNEADDQYGVSFSDPNPPYWSCGFIHANGGTVLNDAYDECTLNSPEAREALQWIVDLTHTHKVAPILVQEDGAEDPFVAGRVAYYFGGTWNESPIRSSGIDWDFLPMPAHPESGNRSVQNGSNAWSILSTSANPDAAWEVMQYIGGAKGAKAVMGAGIPGYTSVIESEEFLALHQPQDIQVPLKDFQEIGHDYYPTEDASEWWAAVVQELGPMWTGEDTVENATQRATDAVNEIFSRRGSL